MYVGRHVTYPLFLSDLRETLIFLTDKKKYSNIKSSVKLSTGPFYDKVCSSFSYKLKSSDSNKHLYERSVSFCAYLRRNSRNEKKKILNPVCSEN